MSCNPTGSRFFSRSQLIFSARLAARPATINHVTLWLLLVVAALATHRITRLIIADHIPVLAVPRDAVLNWLDPSVDYLSTHPTAKPHLGAVGRALAYLGTCPWCMSVWVAGGIVWLLDARFQYSIPLPWLIIAVLSTVTGLLADIEDRLNK